MREIDYCPQCGGQNGAHGPIHVRHPQGGGGTNTRCPLDTRPEPPVPLDLSDALDALQDAAVRYTVGDRRTNEAYGTADYFLVQQEAHKDRDKLLEAARKYGELAGRRRKEIEGNG